MISLRTFADEEDIDTQDQVLLGLASYKKESIKMASILSICTEVLGNAKKSLNSFYWLLKGHLADIGCKVDLCMSDTDSVLYNVTKITKYPLGADKLEQQILDKLLGATGMPHLFDTHNFAKSSQHYNNDHKKELLRFGFEIVSPKEIKKFIGRAPKQYVVEVDNDLTIKKHKGLKSSASVTVQDFHKQLVDIVDKNVSKSVKLFEQYKLVKSNDNDWFLSRQTRQFGFLSDKRVTIGTAGLNQLDLGHPLSLKIKENNEKTLDISELCCDGNLSRLEQIEIDFQNSHRNDYLANGVSNNWRRRLQTAIEHDVFIDEAFYYKNTTIQCQSSASSIEEKESSKSSSSNSKNKIKRKHQTKIDEIFKCKKKKCI